MARSMIQRRQDAERDRIKTYDATRRSVGRRLLTIEVDPQGRAVQVRGLANRLAHADERNVLERWAKARGIALR